MINRTKFLYLGILLSFPVMLSFQNCAKAPTPGAATDKAVNSIIAKVDSNNLPMGQEVNLNQIEGSESAESAVGNDVGIQIQNRELERQQDMDEAEVLCAISAGGNILIGTQVLKTETSVSGLSGNNTLSPEDFNGVKSIESISNSSGKIILCNLHVQDIYQTAGKIILINSQIDNLISHHGAVDIVQGRVIISASQVFLFRSSNLASQ